MTKTSFFYYDFNKFCTLKIEDGEEKMPNEILRYAYANTPSPSIKWRRLSDAERRTCVMDALCAGAAFLNDVVIITAREDGQIIVNLVESMSASKRGTLLLDLEAFLKEMIDPGLVVWLGSLGDRNSLRNLRGIEVKS